MTPQPQAFTPQNFKDALDTLKSGGIMAMNKEIHWQCVLNALQQCANQSKNICDECGLPTKVCNFMGIASREISKADFSDLPPMKKETAVRDIIEKQYSEWVLGETEQCAKGCGDDAITDAAYNYVEQVVENADGFHGNGPWWYGWQVREAFIAGYKHRNQKGDQDE